MKSLAEWLQEIKIPAEHSQEILDAYDEPHRYWHNATHIETVLDYLDQLPGIAFMRERGNPDYTKLVTAALYHDVVYDTTRNDNEEQSAQMMLRHLDGHASAEFLAEITTLIRETDHKGHPSSDLSELLRTADTMQLRGGLRELARYGDAIASEYQRFPYKSLVEEHVRIVHDIANSSGIVNPALEHYGDVLHSRQLNVGIYAGSFNPWHAGHRSIALQALHTFDKVIVARGCNPNKTDSVSEFHVWPCEIPGAPNWLETVEFTGPIWELYNRYSDPEIVGADYAVTLVRGLRDAQDLTAEIRQRTYVQDQAPIPYAFFVATPELAHISSTGIKQMQALGADVGKYL